MAMDKIIMHTNFNKRDQPRKTQETSYNSITSLQHRLQMGVHSRHKKGVQKLHKYVRRLCETIGLQFIYNINIYYRHEAPDYLGYTQVTYQHVILCYTLWCGLCSRVSKFHLTRLSPRTTDKSLLLLCTIHPQIAENTAHRNDTSCRK